jgi:hypothetical protein
MLTDEMNLNAMRNLAKAEGVSAMLRQEEIRVSGRHASKPALSFRQIRLLARLVFLSALADAQSRFAAYSGRVSAS